MSNAIENYETLYNNPFVLMPLFHAFYKELPLQPKSVLLSYLILPLSLYPESRDFLSNAKVSSSLATLQKRSKCLYGLPQRVADYKNLTNLCIQYAFDLGVLAFDENLSLMVLSDSVDFALCPPDSARAARNLARLLGTHTPTEIYRTLGVKAL